MSLLCVTLYDDPITSQRDHAEDDSRALLNQLVGEILTSASPGADRQDGEYMRRVSLITSYI